MTPILSIISSLTVPEMCLRIGVALVAGALIGLERESHGRPAGLRTTMLACVASAMAMVLSEVLFIESAVPGVTWRPDPARLGAGILTGIGFLGAGTIIKHENVVRGVTTAASLWFATVLGLVFGGGQYLLGALGVGVGLLALYGLSGLEKRIESDWYSVLLVTMELDAMRDAQVRERIEASGAKVKKIELQYDLLKKQKTISCDLKVKRSEVFELSHRLVAELAQCPGVLQVKWA